jgi:hypothetical protein
MIPARKVALAISMLCLFGLAGCSHDSGTEVKSDTTPPNAATHKPGTTAASGGAATSQTVKPDSQ